MYLLFKQNSYGAILLLHSIMGPSRTRPQSLWALGDLHQSWIHWREDDAVSSARSETDNAMIWKIGLLQCIICWAIV